MGFWRDLGIWLSGIGGGGGVMGFWSDLGIWLSGIGGGGGVMGYWKDLGIWLSGIGGGGGSWDLERPGDLAVGYRRWGGSWDTGGTWGFGCRV